MVRNLSPLWQRFKKSLPLVYACSSKGLHLLAGGKKLGYEPLEPRIALTATGLVEVGTQPVGELSGKIVYTHGGHGYEAANTGSGSWGFQRPNLLGMIEDLGNQDQMSFFVDYLFRAGATVVPLRPVGHQPNEVVLDNDDVEVTFSGVWSNSGSSIYFGDPGDIPYRFASTSTTETATAEYRPNIPEAGFYPVYSWTRYGSDRAADQLYRVNHSGGSTEVTVNHRRVGNGLVYLGTYYFEAGTSGSVEISNRSSELGRVVIADMIRFGNGIGDIDRGGGVSGRDREDELSVYWFQWHVERAQGVSTSTYRTSPTSDDGTANVGAPPRYAEYMNRETDGLLSDRVFVSFHSNATTGNPATATARGVVGLYNTGSGSNQPTPNQFSLAQKLGQEVNDDLVDQNGFFEHNWDDNGSSTTYGSSFGEIDNNRTNGEFDATIIETGYHDNTQDAEMLRDPRVRDAIARATYQGLVKYFNSVDSGATSLVMLPGKPTSVYAESAGAGSVKVSWTPPAVNSYNGDGATGYMIYGSTNGYGFDGGTYVAGGATSSFTFTGLDISEDAYYFKVAAVNEGGESPSSEVVAAFPNAGDKDILIVNGFDRNDRPLNPAAQGLSPQVDRVRPRQSNSFDYAVQVASSIEANAPHLVVDTTSNEALIAGDVDLSDYKAVVWILGEESSLDDTFNATEQTLVTNYLAGGGKLMVSGAEIGWDLDNLNNGRSFYNNQLKADYVSDDAGTYNVQAAGGSIFAGLPSFSFDDGSLFYDAQYPDRINPLGGATTALTYVGGSGGNAAIQYDGGATKVVNFGFPFETITSESARIAVMDRVLEFFGIGEPTADFNSSGLVDGFDFLAWQRGFGMSSTAVILADGDADGDNLVDVNDFATWESQLGQVPPPLAGSLSSSSADATPQADTTVDELNSAAQRAFGFHGLLAAESELEGSEADSPAPAVEAEQLGVTTAGLALPAAKTQEQPDLPLSGGGMVEHESVQQELADEVLSDWPEGF